MDNTMTSPPTTVTIAGITGKLGLLITKHLLKSPIVHINGLCRFPSKLPPIILQDPKFTIFQSTSTDIAKIRSALYNSSLAICCYLGSLGLMVSGQKILIDACITENVPRYIASDWSLDFRGLEYYRKMRTHITLLSSRWSPGNSLQPRMCTATSGTRAFATTNKALHGPARPRLRSHFPTQPPV
jgi:hypothetical protein